MFLHDSLINYYLDCACTAAMIQLSCEATTTHNDSNLSLPATISDYTILRKLAISGQASLYLVLKDGLYYVLKVYEARGKDVKVFQKEVEIMRKLNGRGIVSIEESLFNVEFINENSQKIVGNIIVMQYYENGDLLEWVCRYSPFNEKSGRFYFKRLLSTFRFIAQKQIFHRDLKPENILLDQNYQPLVLDFGLSGDYHQKNIGFVGSVRYAAPEVIKEKEYTIKSQIYSLGILLFFMLTGNYPYSMAKINQANYRLIFQRKYSVFWQNIQKKTKITLSNSFKELFLLMTCPDASKRPHLDDLLQFNWFKEAEMTQEQYFEYMSSKKQAASM